MCLPENSAVILSDYPYPLRLIQSGKRDEFVRLVTSGEDPGAVLNCVHSRSGDTPAIVAARHGHLDHLIFLQESGIDLEHRNNDGKRALHEAAGAGHVECVKFLLSQHVQVDCLKRADWYVSINVMAVSSQDMKYKLRLDRWIMHLFSLMGNILWLFWANS